MSDLIHRSQKAKMLVEDPSLPKWMRLCRGLQAFSGHNLSSLSTHAAGQFEADLVSINRILTRYALVVDDDYRTFAEVDLNQNRRGRLLLRWNRL